jgi:hypothetical protein
VCEPWCVPFGNVDAYYHAGDAVAPQIEFVLQVSATAAGFAASASLQYYVPIILINSP